MLRTTRTLLLMRLALLATACGGSPDTFPPEPEEGEVVVDNEAALESATSCPDLELSVFDRSTGNTSTLGVPAAQVAATLTETDVLCHPAEEQTYVFSRVSEWVVFDSNGNPRWIPVINVRYSGSTAMIQYVDPDDGISVHTAYVGCEAPPTVTASAPGFTSVTTTADTAYISGALAQDQRGGTLWQLQCDFYASSGDLYASRTLPPVLIPNDEGPYFPDVENPDLTCAPDLQCVENSDCGLGHECWDGCCHVIIR